MKYSILIIGLIILYIGVIAAIYSPLFCYGAWWVTIATILINFGVCLIAIGVYSIAEGERTKD